MDGRFSVLQVYVHGFFVQYRACGILIHALNTTRETDTTSLENKVINGSGKIFATEYIVRSFLRSLFLDDLAAHNGMYHPLLSLTRKMTLTCPYVRGESSIPRQHRRSIHTSQGSPKKRADCVTVPCPSLKNTTIFVPTGRGESKDGFLFWVLSLAFSVQVVVVGCSPTLQTCTPISKPIARTPPSTNRAGPSSVDDPVTPNC